MPDYDTLIQSAAAMRRAKREHEAAADALWKRGMTVEWRGLFGWRCGMVVATDYGRRLFVEDAENGRCGWVAIGSLRSRRQPDADISEEIKEVA
jgi:hypothetical protein